MDTSRPFDVLLFDLGGVLIDFAGYVEMGSLLPESLPRQVIHHRWIASESICLFERGDISAQQFADRFLVEWDLTVSAEAFLGLFVSWARGLYSGAGQLLGSIRKEYRLACLSNSNELHTPLHREAIRPYIGQCFFSNEIGMIKPETEIFDYVVRELAIDAHRIGFFDDTSVNVEAAKKSGLSAFLVDGIDELENELDRLGTLTGEPY